MIIIHGVNGKSARFANERRLSPRPETCVRRLIRGGRRRDLLRFIRGRVQSPLRTLDQGLPGWMGAGGMWFDTVPSAGSGQALRQAHHERVGGLEDDGEDGGLGVTGRTGCGRGSSAGVVELTGWHVALGGLGAAGSRLRTPGCGSTRPAGDSGPAHHERLDAPHVGGCTLNSRAAQAVVVSRAGLKGWMG